MMMNFFCCMKETFRRIQNFHTKSTKCSTCMLWMIWNAKLNFASEKMKFPDYQKHWIFLKYFFCHQGTTTPGIEGLCVLLRRLTYPCRYSDLIPRFGRLIPELSMIYNIVLDHIYNTRGHRISQWNNPILDHVSLERYAEAIHDKGAALDNCIGFIDGTVRSICRPGELQRVVYKGHKRVYALKISIIHLA